MAYNSQSDTNFIRQEEGVRII